MRVTRPILVVVALLVVGLLPAVAPTATAGPVGTDQRPAATPRADEVEEPPPVEPEKITSRVVRRKGEGLYFVGGVASMKGPVYVQKATRCDKEANTCNFSFYRKLFLKKGRYEVKISAPKTLRGWMWRASVRGTVSGSWVTCTKTRAEIEKGKQCKIPFMT